jgi:molybdenum cofactor cytidylyltransferase
MKFGPITPEEAVGATLVHTIRLGARVLKKGTLIGPVEVLTLEAAGIKEIMVARLEPADVSEDVAAAEIAAAIAGEGVYIDPAFTGRANLFAKSAGLLVIDKDAVDRINRVDEAITVATLAAYKPVVPNEMITTVKIIPFAVAKSVTQPGAASTGYPRAPPTSLVGDYQDRQACRNVLLEINPNKILAKMRIPAAANSIPDAGHLAVH